MDLTPTDAKKKDPDSFSLDPENPESYKNLPQLDIPNQEFTSPLSPMASPKLRKIGSFSDEPKPAKKSVSIDTSSLPLDLKLTLNLCKSFNKEIKTVNKISQFISTLDENLKATEQLVKKQEKKIDESFQDLYDQFVKNFLKMTENYKQSLKGKLQQEFSEYRHTHDVLKTSLESLLQHDSFSKLLEAEMSKLIQQKSNTGFILDDMNNEPSKNESYNNLTNFLNSSLECKLGLTPLVKKFELIEYITGRNEKTPFSVSISPNLSEMKKEPLKNYLNLQAEIESFLSRVCTSFSHELSSIVHPYSSFVNIVEKVAKAPVKIFTIDASGKFTTQVNNDVFESYALKKRLSQVDPEFVNLLREELNDESNRDKSNRKSSGENSHNERERSKSPNTPKTNSENQIGSQTISTLTPMRTISYKIHVNKTINQFCESINRFSDENYEVSFKTQLISVHNNLSIGDLVSYNGSPYRILHKEWSFPQDIVKMINIFTGEKIDKTYHSRHEKEIDQIMTKKYSVIKINDKAGYYLLMDIGWEKYDNLRRLPRIFEIKNVLDKKLEEEIKETFETNKKVCLHVLTLRDEEVIVSYRKEWFQDKRMNISGHNLLIQDFFLFILLDKFDLEIIILNDIMIKSLK